jgi:hypothetical protein
MLWQTSLSPAALLSLVLCVGLWLVFFARALRSDRTGKRKSAASSAASVAADAAALAQAQAQQLLQQQQQLYTLIAPAVRERIGLLEEDAFVPSEVATATAGAAAPTMQPLCDARGVNELALGWSTAPRIVCNLPSAPIRAKRFNTWTLFGRGGECVRLKIADLGGGLCFAEIGVAFSAPAPRSSSSASHLSLPGPVVHTEYVAFGGLLGSGGAAAALPDTPLAAFAYDSGRVQVRCTRSRSSPSATSNSPNSTSGGSGGTDADDDLTLSFRVKDCSSLTGAVGTGGLSLLEGCVTVHWPVAHQVCGGAGLLSDAGRNSSIFNRRSCSTEKQINMRQTKSNTPSLNAAFSLFFIDSHLPSR